MLNRTELYEVIAVLVRELLLNSNGNIDLFQKKKKRRRGVNCSITFLDCRFYLTFKFEGNLSHSGKFEVDQAFSSLFSTRKLLPAIHKDALPSTHQSMVVNQYVCRCDCRYVGRISQRLHDRIAQHIPKSIRNKSIPSRILPTRDCKKKIYQSTTVILRLDFTYYKMMNV